MRMKYKLHILVSIIVLAAVLRFWQIGKIPSSVDWDEAALGYNGYSIMLTGRDEYGAFLPIVLRSFGDYKPALYTYLTIPFIALFDLNAVSVRLPSAIAGIVAVLLTYYLVQELFGRWEQGDGKMDSGSETGKNILTPLLKQSASILALLASFLLAISPWHIQFSRVAFEANVGLTLNLAGLLFFLKGIRQPWLLSISALCYAVSFYAYQSEKLFVPIILIILVGIFWKRLFTLPKGKLLTAVALLCFISAPMFIFIVTNKNALARAQGVSFLSYKTALLQNDITSLNQDIKNHDMVGLFLDNRRVIYAKTILASYLSHYNLNWLFLEGDTISRHHAPQMGLLYFFELPFLLLGIYYLLLGYPFHISRKSKVVMLLWFLAAPLPASVTTGVPHAVRTINFLPTFQIFTAFGLLGAFVIIKKYQVSGIKYQGLVKTSLYTCFSLLAFLNVAYYLDQYFVQQNYYNAQDWQYGFKQLINFLQPIRGNYNKVIVSNKGTFDESYMFFLFYSKYDPRQYLAEGGTQADGVETKGNKFSNYEFRTFNVYQENDLPLLFVGSPQDFPENFNKINQIVYPDGSDAMHVVEKR